jgi:gamma-glutamylcyclotransferase (GGCT)/AIG2-like uncharacterized protein YtfP
MKNEMRLLAPRCPLPCDFSAGETERRPPAGEKAAHLKIENLFAYGTLMCEDIMLEVGGCLPAVARGTLQGYFRSSVKNEHYPGILRDDRGAVDGIVYMNIPDCAWERLDKFEGEMYSREPVRVELTNGFSLEASAYVMKPDYYGSLLMEEWSFSEFLKTGKRDFLKKYKGFSLF